MPYFAPAPDPAGRPSRRPPILASIGTVLIDEFVAAPRERERKRPATSKAPIPGAADGSVPAPRPATPSTTSSSPASSWSSLPVSSASSPQSPACLPLSSPVLLSDSTAALIPNLKLELELDIERDLGGVGVFADKPEASDHRSSRSALLHPPLPATRTGSRTPQLTFEDGDGTWGNDAGAVEQLGGGALYALVGARIWLASSELRTLIDRQVRQLGRGGRRIGGDLPEALERELEAYGPEIWDWREGEGTRMTRARIRYDGDVRLFQSIVKAPYRPFASLVPTSLHGAEYLHISPPYSPEDVYGLLQQIDTCHESQSQSASAKGKKPELWSPKIVFEPAPISCHDGQREWLERVLPGLAVLSPNHEELLSIYSHPLIPLSAALIPIIESLVSHLLDLGIGPDGAGIVVVRCGRMGSCVGTRRGGLRWFPAYFGGDEETRVLDVTGAGNSFLGGYVAGLALSGGDPYEAALYATVSASFVVEQAGLPVLTTTSEAKELADAPRERWNGKDPLERVEKFRAKVAAFGGRLEQSEV